MENQSVDFEIKKDDQTPNKVNTEKMSNTTQKSECNWLTCLVLTFFCLDRIYTGRTISGIFKFLGAFILPSLLRFAIWSLNFWPLSGIFLIVFTTMLLASLVVWFFADIILIVATKYTDKQGHVVTWRK